MNDLRTNIDLTLSQIVAETYRMLTEAEKRLFPLKSIIENLKNSEFEQEIMECWKITNDLQMYIDQGASIEDTKVLIDYYERKFQKVWDTFETLIKERKIL